MKLPNLDKIYIASDSHGFHKNITRGTTEWTIDQRQLADGNVIGVRDFDTPEEMTETMARNFNAIIPHDGILIHLGDWSFGGEANIPKFREMLNVSEIHLITGNHDSHQERGKWDNLFTSRHKYLELSVEKINFILFHFPITSWNFLKHNTYQLHGHMHWKGDNRFGNGRQMDVGVDGNNLCPYKLTDVIELLKDREYHNPKDHHTR